jgi:N-formylglutamate deformylase
VSIGGDVSEAVYRFHQGAGPLIVAMPHVGADIPPELAERLTAVGQGALDTDWHVDRLYDFLDEVQASRLIARQSRNAVDLNRSPENEALYPGRFETGLCPTTTFEGQPLYRDGHEPDPGEVTRRVEAWWRPYHDRLREALDEARERHGYALLLDAHSIRAEIPLLFEGRLPDINVGTADGRSCDPGLTAAIEAVLAEQGHFTWVTNGRFKGGWTTRNYGRPADGVHAVQFELVQDAYMDEANPHAFDADRARPMRDLLRELVDAIAGWRP